jgi:hypothetical protein
MKNNAFCPSKGDAMVQKYWLTLFFLWLILILALPKPVIAAEKAFTLNGYVIAR